MFLQREGSWLREHSLEELLQWQLHNPFAACVWNCCSVCFPTRGCNLPDRACAVATSSMAGWPYMDTLKLQEELACHCPQCGTATVWQRSLTTCQHCYAVYCCLSQTGTHPMQFELLALGKVQQSLVIHPTLCVYIYTHSFVFSYMLSHICLQALSEQHSGDLWRRALALFGSLADHGLEPGVGQVPGPQAAGLRGP